MMKSYKVKYKVGSSTTITSLTAHSNSESAIIAALKKMHVSLRDKDIIILEIY